MFQSHCSRAIGLVESIEKNVESVYVYVSIEETLAYAGDFDSPNNTFYYDKQKTIELIDTFIKNAPEGYRVQVFFNDQAVIDHFASQPKVYNPTKKKWVSVVSKLEGHDDHIHFQLVPISSR
jgi:hypothetical protein